MEKRAITTSGLKSALGLGASIAGAVGLGAASVFAVKSAVNKVNNDASCKRIIEDLSLNDPILKNVDKGTLLEWYASMYNVAPTLARDKQTVMETLRNFARFNKIDMNTLKLLADTEKSVSGSKGGSPFIGSSMFFGK